MTDDIAIVGANVAGANAAFALRKAGFDGRIVLIGAEPQLPYERPPLSKSILLGTAEPTDAELWPASAYEEAQIELVLGITATELRLGERSVALADGRCVAAGKVLLTTGARPRAVPFPGGDGAAVHELRSIADALRLRAALHPGSKVVVIGAGFVGAEVAAAARVRDCAVTLVETAPLPLQRVLGPEFGELYAQLHRSNGVDLRLGANVSEIHGSTVVLADGARIPADVVVCGVGVAPATELAHAAGIRVRNGIVVNGTGRTSVPDVFAAGDVANRPSSYMGATTRFESWQNAQDHAIAAATAMLGSGEVYDDVPWFWSDQYDVKLQIAGAPHRGEEIVWRGDRGGSRCLAFYCSGDRVLGIVGLNRARDVRAGMELIRSAVAVDAGALADESVSLRALARPSP